MKKNKLLIALAIAACSTAVIADDEKIDYSLSVKTWHNNLYVANKDTNITLQAANSPIIGLTAKKGDYFVTVQTMMESSYHTVSSPTNSTWLARKDLDFAFGYRYNPNVSLIAGYKTLWMKDGSQTNWLERHSGVYFGVAGFKPVTDSVFAYGNFTYAPSMSNEGTSVIDNTNSIKFMNYEVGAGYTLTNTSQLIAGLRTQQVKDYNVTMSRSEKVVMKGLILGVNVNF